MITILDLGKELKKLDNFDKDEYIKALEKEVARFIRNADIHVINHQKMYEELRATKHALWMARALRAKAKVGKYVGEWCLAHRDYESKMETYWDNQQDKWRWVERKCLDKAKEFE